MRGKISKFESMGAVDGPGLRYVVFFQGCNLRCACCHNPETWNTNLGTEYESADILERAMRYKSYYGENGGITFSGGEPLLQTEFLKECAKLCKDNGIHTALDTSGSLLNSEVSDTLKYIDLVILDIKMTTREDYFKYTGGSLKNTIEFLKTLEQFGKDTWIRQVIIPTINDNTLNINRLKKICNQYSCIKKIELLPFKKLCIPKYEQLGMEFKFANIPECRDVLVELGGYLL
jgi:pyruvate formate lyase activating enzyme